MHVEARVRPDCSPSAQESFILRQTWEKGTVVIRPMEGGGEKRLITSCLEKVSEATDIKNSEGHLQSNVVSHSIKIEKSEMKKKDIYILVFSFPIYEILQKFHYVVICRFISNILNRANWNWTANRGLTVQVSLSAILPLSLADLQPLLLSLSCVSVCSHILTLRMLSQESFWPQAGSERSWNIDRTDSPRQHDEWAGVIEGDEASREVILPWKKMKTGEWELRCRGPIWKKSSSVSIMSKLKKPLLLNPWRS